MAEVYIQDTNLGIRSAVNKIFDQIEKNSPPILKKSKEVYIKVNGINFKKHTYTSPNVLEELIQEAQKHGTTALITTAF